MAHRNCWVNFLQISLIILLISGSAVFIFESEINQQLHLQYLHQKGKIFRILFLVNNITENYIPNATSIRVYNTLCTLGLAEGISYVFSIVRLPYEFVFYETDKQEELNKTYLDSFDLIVVGGVTYWWIYASESDRRALIKTETPILTSVNLGLNNTPALNSLTGVYHASKNNYEAWRSVFPMGLTKIIYTNIASEALKSNLLTSRIYIINVVPTKNAQLLAYALRNGKQYPYIVFNGTKNYYINTYTYRGIKQVHKDLLVILDMIFDLFTEEYLTYKIGYMSTLKIIANTLVMVLMIFVSCIIGCCAIKLGHIERMQIKVEIKVNNLKRAIFLSGLLLVFIMLIFFSFKTYKVYFAFESYISIKYLVGAICIFIAIISATISASK